MHTSTFSTIIQAMAEQGVRFEQGLSDEEIRNIEVTYQITFPPDLKTFLTSALPVSDGFIHWRTEHKDAILYKLQLPVTILMFKVKYHDFWLESWGIKPCEAAMLQEVALGQLQSQPRLIPIYQDHYISAEPHDAGNPVISVSQGTFRYEAADLPQFFTKHFQVVLPEHFGSKEIRPIRFWHQVVQ